jgi:lauroyl/myristoyl acyltransferase
MAKMIEARVDRYLEIPAFRKDCEDQMLHLLGATHRASEAPQLARGYAISMMERSWYRWHPRWMTHQEVRGIEWLRDRDMSRPYILSFMHHNHYAGLFGSLSHAGVRTHIVMSPKIIGDVGAQFVQHRKVVSTASDVIPAVGGTDAIAAQALPGRILCIAPDLPGTTEVTFLGQRRRGSFGAARIAKMVDAPIVLATARQNEDGSGFHIRVQPPIESRDFSDPRDLLDETLRHHEDAILAWPEVVEAPRARFGTIV